MVDKGARADHVGEGVGVRVDEVGSAVCGSGQLRQLLSPMCTTGEGNVTTTGMSQHGKDPERAL